MIANLIGGFVAILIGTSLIGPVSETVMNNADSVNSSGGTCQTSTATQLRLPGEAQCALYTSSSWGATVLKLAPGFFALGIMGIGVAVTYSSLRQAGIV